MNNPYEDLYLDAIVKLDKAYAAIGTANGLLVGLEPNELVSVERIQKWREEVMAISEEE